MIKQNLLLSTLLLLLTLAFSVSGCADSPAENNATIGSPSGNNEPPLNNVPPSSLPGIAMHDGNLTITDSVNFFDNGGSAENYFLTEQKDQFLTLHPAEKGKKIQLSFSAFDVASNDLLYIYNGSGANKKLIGIYSGNYNKEIQDPDNALKTIEITLMPTITSTASDGSLTIRFDNNSNSESFRGWRATIEQVEHSNILLMREDNVTVNTPITFYGNGGAQSNTVSNIKNSTSIIFTPSDKQQFISIAFENFNLSSKDEVDLYYIENNRTIFFKKYSGNHNYTVADPEAATKRIVKCNIPAFIHFNAGASVMVKYIKRSGTSAGWRAKVSQTKTHGAIFQLQGTFQLDKNLSSYHFYDDGGKNGNYNLGKRVMTIYPSTKGKKVSINFTAVNMYFRHKLYLYDGNSTAHYIGYATNPVVITSTAENGALTLVMNTSGSSSYVDKGWEATLTTVE